MATRRGFLAGLLAAGLVPKPGWADVGGPAFLAAAKLPEGGFHLFGLDPAGATLFSVPLPDRGHAAAAHPSRPQVVAFARRPGTFALVIDCMTGKTVAQLDAPEGRHFYGHGIFSVDGSLMFTPENDYEVGQGRIGIWDCDAGYTRVGEFSSHGVGPHDVVRLPGQDILVVANGGIDTHPDSGRTKLNLPTMRPNLSYVDLDGRLIEQVELDPALHHNSIRHLAIRDDGLVAFAMQWQGDTAEHPPLLGLHQIGSAPVLLSAPGDLQPTMKGYGASVAFSGDGQSAGISSSRGNTAHFYDVASAGFATAITAPDVSGLSGTQQGFLATTGLGEVLDIRKNVIQNVSRHPVSWDNHLISI